MLYISLSMAAGIVAGVVLLSPGKHKCSPFHRAKKAQGFFANLLLLLLGLWIGANPEFWANLRSIGLSGALFAVLCTGGSIAAVFAVEKLLLQRRDK